MSGSHTERYTGVEMGNYMVREHGATFLRQRGDHIHYALPDGRRVGTLQGERTVPTALARRNAEVLDMHLNDFRAGIGYPTPNASRPKRHTVARSEHEPSGSKSDALAALREVQELARCVEQGLRCGIRDSEVYKQAQTAAAGAKRAIEKVAGRVSS